MALGYAEAIAAVTGAGSPLEIEERVISDVSYRFFKHAPKTLRDIFSNSRAFGDKPFLVYEQERWSFDEVMAAADALGHALVETYGIKKGDRVAINMRNLPEWVVCFAAILSIGGVSVSFNAWWTDDEVDYALEDSGARVIIVDSERVERAAQSCARLGVEMIVARPHGEMAMPQGAKTWNDVVHLGDKMPEVEVDGEDFATILYTSGTTGRPKGAVSTHRAIIQALMSFGAGVAVQQLRKDVEEMPAPQNPPAFILIVPLFHVTGNVPVMLTCFTMGLKLVMMYKWEPEEALKLIEAERITNFVGVPTQSWDLLECANFKKYDTSSLTNIGGGGAPAPAKLVSRVDENFKVGKPQIGYGMTETNAYGPGNYGEDYLTHPTSTGRARLPVMDVEIRDEHDCVVPIGTRGEIWMKGPNLISGYWQRPEATAETIVDGWLRSGDIGRIDEDGFLYIEDRAKDMVLRGGENVYCAEVESAIYEHPAVYEAAVFGLPHERLGEEVAAVVVLKDQTALSVEELQHHVASRLAAFKVPSTVVLTYERLPRNPQGKVLKRELRDTVVSSSS